MKVKHSKGVTACSFLSLQEIANSVSNNRRFFISDENVWSLYGSRMNAGDDVLVVPAGESSKSLYQYGELLEKLAAAGVTRDTCLVAFGGGVVGDLAGFVAATYMRGLTYIQIPTTLLAQVDSSVGGKVAVNLGAGKNLVGAFHPPFLVWIPVEVLQTLPEREFNSGMAEVWKYGFIFSQNFVKRLEEEKLNAKSPRLRDIIEKCIQYKADVVNRDEFETTGERAVLNFGHTVGHAIERVTGYDSVLHGEAISIGMVVETLLGERLGITPRGTWQRVKSGLESQGLPTTSESLREVDRLIEAMKTDKKATTSGLAFSLLTTIGRCKLIKDVPEADVRAILAEL